MKLAINTAINGEYQQLLNGTPRSMSVFDKIRINAIGAKRESVFDIKNEKI